MRKKSSASVSDKLKMNQIMTLRGKTPESVGVVQVKLGAKKYELPLPAHIVSGDGKVFVSFSNVATIFDINDDKKALEPVKDLDGSYKGLLKATSTGRTRQVKDVSVDPALLDDLNKLQKKLEGAGYKLGFNPKEGIKIVKPRAKKK